jgi:hypothetical protein
MKPEFSQHIFEKYLDVKFLVGAKLFHLHVHTHRWMDMTKLTVTLCNFVNTPKKLMTGQ